MEVKNKAAEAWADHLDKLKEAKVISDVIDAVDGGPQRMLDVKYGSKPIAEGVELSKEETAEAPDVTIHAQEGTYTLMMVDPDAPSPAKPTYRCWLHWLITNIPASDLVRGEELVEYMGPSPPKGKHRYVFLVFKQKGHVDAAPPANRPGFQVQEWAKTHSLAAHPSDATFFYCEP